MLILPPTWRPALGRRPKIFFDLCEIIVIFEGKNPPSIWTPPIKNFAGSNGPLQFHIGGDIYVVHQFNSLDNHIKCLLFLLVLLIAPLYCPYSPPHRGAPMTPPGWAWGVGRWLAGGLWLDHGQLSSLEIRDAQVRAGHQN